MAHKVIGVFVLPSEHIKNTDLGKEVIAGHPATGLPTDLKQWVKQAIVLGSFQDTKSGSLNQDQQD